MGHADVPHDVGLDLRVRKSPDEHHGGRHCHLGKSTDVANVSFMQAREANFLPHGEPVAQPHEKRKEREAGLCIASTCRALLSTSIEHASRNNAAHYFCSIEEGQLKPENSRSKDTMAHDHDLVWLVETSVEVDARQGHVAWPAEEPERLKDLLGPGRCGEPARSNPRSLRQPLRIGNLGRRSAAGNFLGIHEEESARCAGEDQSQEEDIEVH
mmetsp:Transcript_756/g.1813  ORF Transcript_756/g.1813 Transcript_756/m.1813 type:complete len:213 (-) Transcript_756:599-1237(-)